MKHNYKYLPCSLLLTTLLLTGCRQDEELNLVGYPANPSSLVVSDGKGASEVKVSATYKDDGTLQLDAPASRTYVFTIAASPEDATVIFEPFSNGIPSEEIEISNTETVIPAGSTETYVTVKLKDENLGFARAEYDAKTYELGVKATIKGYRIDGSQAKVIINKESYVASCFISEAGREVAITRLVLGGALINPEPASFTFTVELDKPARKDVKVNFTTAGLDANILEGVTISPETVIIPAGQVKSQDITWTINDDFLLETDEDGTYPLTLTASSIESDDPVVVLDEDRNTSTINIIKTSNNLQNFYEMQSSWNWEELSKADWTLEVQSGVSNPEKLIDGVTYPGDDSSHSSELARRSGGFWFMVDMQTEKTIAGLSFDYYSISAGIISVSYSTDNVNWIDAGRLDVKYHAFEYTNNYVNIISPIKARYMKIQLTAYAYYFSMDVYEAHFYKLK